jgi:hypothetical protein
MADTSGLTLPVLLQRGRKRVEVCRRPANGRVLADQPMEVARGRKLRFVGGDDPVEAFDPHVLVIAGELVVRRIREHPFDEIRGRHAIGQQSLFDHRVPHVLEDPHHGLEVAGRENRQTVSGSAIASSA